MINKNTLIYRIQMTQEVRKDGVQPIGMQSDRYRRMDFYNSTNFIFICTERRKYNWQLNRFAVEDARNLSIPC